MSFLGKIFLGLRLSGPSLGITVPFARKSPAWGSLLLPRPSSNPLRGLRGSAISWTTVISGSMRLRISCCTLQLFSQARTPPNLFLSTPAASFTPTLGTKSTSISRSRSHSSERNCCRGNQSIGSLQSWHLGCPPGHQVMNAYWASMIVNKRASHQLKRWLQPATWAIHFAVNLRASHWCSVSIDLHVHPAIIVYDTVKSRSSATVETEIHGIVKGILAASPRTPSFQNPSFFAAGVPLQEDDFNCGVWTIYYLLQLINQSLYEPSPVAEEVFVIGIPLP